MHLPGQPDETLHCCVQVKLGMSSGYYYPQVPGLLGICHCPAPLRWLGWRRCLALWLPAPTCPWMLRPGAPRTPHAHWAGLPLQHAELHAEPPGVGRRPP